MEEQVVNKTNTESLNAELETIKENIKIASAEINLILAKNKLEFAVAHKISVNADLKQEEIAHEIVIRPTK